MKHLVFAAACLGVLPLAFLLSRSRRWLRVAFAGVVAAMCLWNATSISFFVEEGYRGTSRGLDVSLAWLASFVLLFALAFARRLRGGLLPDAGSRLYLLYALLCLPSLSSAADTLIAWFEVWKMIMLFFFYLAVYYYLRTTDDLRTILGGLATFAIVNMVMVIKNHFEGYYQPHGVFPHQNCMAVAMHVFGALFFAYYIMHGMKTYFGKVCTLGFICAAAATLRSYSRVAIVLMAVSYGLTSIICLTTNYPWRRAKRILPLALIGTLCFGALLPHEVRSTAAESIRITYFISLI